ncbi:MAG: DUF3990 domain-containing protein [Phascolarctobacterium sp.]|nr:DUF3990 domain-containing protein [Phascolarctobacterium sp.]
MRIYHGSKEIIYQPLYGKGKLNNDYGQGFYCTPHIELAKEWGCGEDYDGYANIYELDVSHLKQLYLIDISQLQRLECGERKLENVSLKTALKLARALGINVEQLSC